MYVLVENAENVDKVPTRGVIEKALKWLVTDVQPGDVLWFHFSGHGVQEFDKPSNERDGVDEAIQPLDYQTSGNIADKFLRAVLVDTLPKGSTLYAMLDCCHSGDMLDMRYVYDELTRRMESDPEVHFHTLCHSTSSQMADLTTKAYTR